MSGQLDVLPRDEQQEVARILLRHSYALVKIEVLQADVTQTVRDLVRNSNIPRRTLLEHVLRVLEQPHDLPREVQQQWKTIEHDIIGGDDYAARIHRNVTLPAWHFFKAGETSTEPWAELAAKGLQDPDKLRPQFEWLLSNEAQSAGPFGYELGRQDTGYLLQRDLLDAVMQAGSSVNYGLLGGYLHAMREKAPDRWLSIIESLASDPSNIHLFPGVVMQSGLTDGAANTLYRLANSGAIAAEYLQGFIFGREVAKLSKPMFHQWLELLLRVDTQRALIAALRLLHSYYADNESPRDVDSVDVEGVVFHEKLFMPPEADSKNAHLDFNWSQVTRRFLLENPDKKLTTVRKLIESMGEESVVLPRFDRSEAKKLLMDLSKESPRETWKVAMSLLGPPIDARAYSIKEWLAGAEDHWQSNEDAEKVTSILHAIPPEDIWAWVDIDTERRAWYLATFVPKDLLLYPQQTSLVREILIRYGAREDVQRNLMANFSSEGWMGPESEHYGEKIIRLDQALVYEPEPNVREWLQLYIRSLKHSVERAKMKEEREAC